MFWAFIRKFNPYHDENGRFTTAENATEVKSARSLYSRIAALPMRETKHIVERYGDGKSVQNSNNLDALYNAGKAGFAGFVSSVKALAGETKGRVMIGPIKLRDKAEAKIRHDYGGDASRLTDIIRATIAYPDVHSMYEGLKNLERHFGIVVLRDNYRKTTNTGYADINTKVRLPNGHIAELQLNTEAMLAVKEAGHVHYNRAILMEQRVKLTGKPFTLREKADYLNEARAQIRLYREARERLLLNGR